MLWYSLPANDLRTKTTTELLLRIVNTGHGNVQQHPTNQQLVCGPSIVPIIPFSETHRCFHLTEIGTSWQHHGNTDNSLDRCRLRVNLLKNEDEKEDYDDGDNATRSSKT